MTRVVHARGQSVTGASVRRKKNPLRTGLAGRIQKRGIMAGDKKKGFRTVEAADMEEYRKKLRTHRLKMLKAAALAVVVLLLIAVGIGLYLTFREYEAYEVRSSVERSDTQGTKFAEFCGNILKYSNDGAFYTDTENELIWNQTYEMANPCIDICEKYVVIYDKGGTKLFILDTTGPQGSLEMTMPIDQVCVASQGTVAVLMKQSSTANISLYDREGAFLAGGEIHGEKGGYPIAIALSGDAIKLAVSMLDINEGSVRSTIAFYNYGSIGQNEIDNIVGTRTFENLVIPELKFVSGSRMLALGDSEIVIFEGTQKPKVEVEIPLEKEAKSIFYNQEYIGIVNNNDGDEVTHHLLVYNIEGVLRMEQDLELDYSRICFLSNNEILVQNETVCDLYTIRGVHRFHYEFDQELYQVIPGKSGGGYTFLLKDATEKVRLR